MIKIEPKTVVISNITLDLFNKLSSEHGQTLSCSTKTIIIPYKNFVLHKITMHPICSSIFINPHTPTWGPHGPQPNKIDIIHLLSSIL